VADAPWRCSQCGTVNEPVANACRTCGHWPSLFDLESGLVDLPPPAEREPADVYAPSTVEVAEPEPASQPIAPPEEARLPQEFEPSDEEAGSDARRPGWRRYVRLVVPIAIAAYVLISSFVGRG